MGYLHSWSAPKALTPAFIDAVAKVIAEGEAAVAKATPFFPERKLIRLADASGNPGTRPVVGLGGILFNGEGEARCETFSFAPGVRNYCKTQQHPYDLVVVAVLSLAQHLGLTCVNSYGDSADWRDGVELVRRATGLDIRVPDTLRSDEPAG